MQSINIPSCRVARTSSTRSQICGAAPERRPTRATMNGAARRARLLCKRSRQNSVFRCASLRRPSISAFMVLAGAQREQWCAVAGVPKACATGLKHASPCATARRRATARAVLQPAPSALILRVASGTRACIPSFGVTACRAGARAKPRRSWSRERGSWVCGELLASWPERSKLDTSHDGILIDCMNRIDTKASSFSSSSLY
jgi:hypothetical protein